MSVLLLLEEETDMTCGDCREEFVLHPHSEYTGENWISKGRSVTLLNISVYRCGCGDGPQIPYLALLLDGLSACPSKDRWRWCPEAARWETA